MKVFLVGTLLVLGVVLPFPVTYAVYSSHHPASTVQIPPMAPIPGATPARGLIDWSTVTCTGGDIGGSYQEVCGDAEGHYVAPSTAHQYGK